MAQPVTDGASSEAPPPVAGQAAPGTLGMAAFARGVAICVLPIVVGLYVAASAFVGGTLLPWRPQMVDLDVYRRAGTRLLEGADFRDRSAHALFGL